MEPYANIREILGDFIGRPILDITQHDQEYFERTSRSFVDLMFDGGDILRIYIGDVPVLAVNPSDEGEATMFHE